MPFDPYSIVPFTIPEEVVGPEETVTLIALGTRDEEKWSTGINGPTFQLPVWGTLRVDPSTLRSQVVEIVRAWIVSECESLGLTVISFEDKGNPFENHQYADTSLLVEFQIRHA